MTESLFVEEQHSQATSLPDTGYQPLAERLRPTTLADVLGQEHLLSSGKPLYVALTNSETRTPSCILWGPPGVGKTTIARLFADRIGAPMYRISAIESGVKEMRDALAKAEKRRVTEKPPIFFIDEIHRFNKSQQDILLHAVERGAITLIGATTENPSFELNPALLSRCQVYRLLALGPDHIFQLIQRALDFLTADYQRPVQLEDYGIFLHRCHGDARQILNILDVAGNIAKQENPDPTQSVLITHRHCETVLQQNIPLYDKKGENHYDIISAFIKSLRGSDPDAALFWMAYMLEAGEDPLFIARRMLIFASEDVGNADPQALVVALSVFQAVERIGMPEARINLAQGVTYLASAAKSNASYLAVEAAFSAVRQCGGVSVPLHLRNAPTRLMKQEGYGTEYLYPHDFPDAAVEQRYFPDELPEQVFYQPKSAGHEAEFQKNLHQRHPERYDKSKS